MVKRYGTVIKSFWSEESGRWHLIVQEDELIEQGTTATLLHEDPGFRPGDRVYCIAGLRRTTSPWRSQR